MCVCVCALQDTELSTTVTFRGKKTPTESNNNILPDFLRCYKIILFVSLFLLLFRQEARIVCHAGQDSLRQGAKTRCKTCFKTVSSFMCAFLYHKLNLQQLCQYRLCFKSNIEFPLSLYKTCMLKECLSFLVLKFPPSEKESSRVAEDVELLVKQ